MEENNCLDKKAILNNYKEHNTFILENNSEDLKSDLFNDNEILNNINKIIDNRPSFKNIFSNKWTLESYTRNIFERSEILDKFKDNDKISNLLKIINNFIDNESKNISLDNIPSIINTGDHFWILSHPMFLWGNKVYSDYLDNKVDNNSIITFAWENVSMNNPSYPRWIILNSYEKISFVSDKNKHYNFSDNNLEFKSVNDIWKILNSSDIINNELKEIVINEFWDYKTDTKKTIFNINSKIWKILFKKDFLHLPINTLVTEYIIQNFDIFSNIFLENKDKVREFFEDKYWWYILNNNKINWTSIWYLVSDNQKHKKSILLDDKWYYYDNDNNKIYISDNDIYDFISIWNIQLSLSSIYIVLIDMWILPLWWFNQIDYIKNYLEFYQSVSWKDMNDYIESIYMFLWFNFWDINIINLLDWDKKLDIFWKSKINGMIDIDFISKII